jgi:hypothetical protein
MATRCCLLLGLSLCLVNVAFGGQPPEPPRPERSAPSTDQQKAISSAIEHLHVAAGQLQAVGLAREAAQLRDHLSQLTALARQAPVEPTRPLAGHQSEAPKPQPVGRPNQIVFRCKFVELAAAAAEEFDATAEPVTLLDWRKNASHGLAIFKNADAVVLKLAKSGKAKILGSPELCTTFDLPASVLSGGEFPILVPQGNQTATIQWRQFGARCTAVPHWLDTGRIQIDATPELTTRDFTHCVVASGLTIPSLTTRRANVRVEMNLGETAVVNFGADTEKVEVGAPRAENDAVSLLPPVVQSVIRLANAEIEIPPPRPPVTLFLVTPVAAKQTHN